MDSPVRRVITRTTVRLEVPAEQGPHGGGASYKAMGFAIHQAVQELRETGQIPAGLNEPADDAIMFIPGDDAIVLEFELPDVEHEQGTAQRELAKLRGAVTRVLDHIGSTGRAIDAWEPSRDNLDRLATAEETVPVPAAEVRQLASAAQVAGVGGWWSQ